MAELENYLQQLGQAKIMELLGANYVQQISDLSSSLRESVLSKILLAKYGSSILGNKDVRNSVLNILPDETIQKICKPLNTQGYTKRDEFIGFLSDQKWNPKDLFPGSVIEALEISPKYLPETKESVVDSFYVEPDLLLHEYQVSIRARLIGELTLNGNKCLLHMPTGSGKTRTAFEAVSDFWRTQTDGLIVWLAHSEELCEQAIETWEKIWKSRGDQKLPIFRLWGSHSPDFTTTSNGIVVAGLQKIFSLYKGNSKNFSTALEIQNKVKIIIVDEAHKALAPTYKNVIDFLMLGKKNPRLLGLTATPGRSGSSGNQENEQLVEMFGGAGKKIGLQNRDGTPILNPVRYLQELKILAKIKRVPLPIHVGIEATKDEIKELKSTGIIPKSLLHRIGNNPKRNKIIFEEIKRLVSQGKKIIVFACSVEQAHVLSMVLISEGIDARTIDGQTNSLERKETTESFKTRGAGCKVLINYEVLTTGFDAPLTDCVVIARPTSSIILYAQMIGRGLRGLAMKGNEFCTVVDVVDNILNYPDEDFAFNYFNDYWQE